MLRGALVMALGLASACFDAQVAECVLRCAESACPSGFECTAAGLCRPVGSSASCEAADADPDAGGPDPEPGDLVDRGLLVRYFLDEAADGTAPDRARDSASSPLDLALHYGDASYTQDADGNRGLHFAAVDTTARASTPVRDTKVDDALDDSHTGTIEVVVRVEEATDQFSRIAHIGRYDDSGDFTLGAYSPTAVVFAAEPLNNPIRWEDEIDLQRRTVLHLVFDGEEIPGRQLVLYVNGEQRATPAGAELSEDIAIDITDEADMYLALGNREIGARSFLGDLFYAAYYSEALTGAEVELNARRLAASDDE